MSAPARPLPPLDGPLFGHDGLLAVFGASIGRRLTTVTGPPGVGKTRVAGEIARWALAGLAGQSFRGGVVWADLSAARTAEEAMAAIAAALDLALFTTEPADEICQALLQRWDVFLVLDGAEQVRAPLRTFLDRALDVAPKLTVLVTSRIALGAARELLVALGPLPVPAPGASAESLAREPGVRLLLDRLRHFPGGQLARDPAYLPALGALVRRLEGLPHALVLAVAAPPQTPALEVLNAAVSWAEGGLVELAPTAEGAAALRASMARSWALLPPWARSALAQTTVFRGGFTLQAAEAVIDLSEWPDAPPAAELLRLLLAHHLVATTDTTASAPRFTLSAVCMAFGLDRLASVKPPRNDGREPTEARHGRWFARLGSARAREQGRRAGGGVFAAAQDAELENLRAAWRRSGRRNDSEIEHLCAEALLCCALRHGAAERVMDLVLPLLDPPHPVDESCRMAADGAQLLAEYGRFTDAQRLLSQAMSALGQGGSDALRALLLSNIAALMLSRRSEEKGRALAQRALDLARGCGDGATLSLIRFRRAGALRLAGRPSAAMAELDEALRAVRASGDLLLEAVGLGVLGELLVALGQPADALVALRRAAALAQDLGWARPAAVHRAAMIRPMNTLGRSEEAESLARELLPVLGAMGDDGALVAVWGALGAALLARGQRVEGRRALEEAVRCARRTPLPAPLAAALCDLGAAILEQGRAGDALPLFAEAAAAAQALGDPLQTGRARVGQAEALAQLGRIPDAMADFSAAEALIRKTEDRLALLALLVKRGLVRAAQRQPEAAGDLEAAEALARELAPDGATQAGLVRLRAAGGQPKPPS